MIDLKQFNPLNDPYTRNQISENTANKALQTDIMKSNNAKSIAQVIQHKLIEFQSSLLDTEDVAIQAVQFGTTMTIYVDKVTNLGYSLVVFQGKDGNNNPCELVQHINQASILMITVPKPVEVPRRIIGFQAE